MAITEYAELDGVTIGATEHSITSNTSFDSGDLNTDAGIFQLWVDPVGAAMAKGDYFAIRIYEKVEATGGTHRVVYRATLGNAQSEALVTPALILMHGWDMTLQKLAGTDRAFDASVRQLA